MPIKLLVLGRGGLYFGFGGGGKCRFCFYGRGDFSEKSTQNRRLSKGLLKASGRVGEGFCGWK